VEDKIAEPYRAGLIPAFYEVKESAMKHGALACSISGSGPSIFAFADKKTDAEIIAAAMKKSFKKQNIKSTSYISMVNKNGVHKI
jgi:homoserine kinase